MKKIIILVLVVFAAIITNAQNTIQDELNRSLEAQLTIIGKPSPDSITLRWGVSKPEVWEYALTNGYVVEKSLVTDLNVKVDEIPFTPLSQTPFKMWSEEEWKKALNGLDENSDDYAMCGIAISLSGLIDEDENNMDGGDLFSDGLNTLGDGKSMVDNRFGFSMVAADRSKLAANGMGLRFVDKDIQKGKTYIYKISLPDYKGIYKIEPSYVIISAVEYVPSFPNLDLKIDSSEQSISMSINKPSTVNSFFVERSLDGSNYQRLNETPINNANASGYNGATKFVYLDDSLVNYQEYYYRFYGSTPFGDEVLVTEFTAMPVDRKAPPRPFILQPDHVNPETVKIEWEFNSTDGDIDGFNVMRSNDVHGPYTKLNNSLLTEKTREYQDKDFSLDGKNYYQVQAFDTAGNASYSREAYVTLIDSTPPAIPVFLEGSMDSLGVVTLVLRANDERDLMGYRLLKANQADHEFSVFQDRFSSDSSAYSFGYIITDTVSLSTLTEEVFYKATSLDFNYNESELSAHIMVKRPDKRAPVSPLIKHYTVTDKSILIQFVPSTSKDVVSHTLLRREDKSTEWKSIGFFENTENSFTDTSVKPNKYYEYTLYATDDSENNSPQCRPVRLRPYPTGLNDVFKPVAKYLADSNLILVDWKSDEKIDPKGWFVLMKKENNNEWVVVQQTKDTLYRDKRYAKNSTIEYRLKYYTEYSEGVPVSSNVVSFN
jgi:hypothetical protein